MRLKTNLSLLFIIIVCLSIPHVSYSFLQTVEAVNIGDNDLLHGGWIIELNDLLVLHTEGSYYQMGYQHGYLLKEKIQKNMLIYFNYFDSIGTTFQDFLTIWNKTKAFVPEHVMDELRGIADGSELSFETIAVANIVPMKYHCALFSAWGNATDTGDLYFARSLDYTYIKDPITGEDWNSQVLIIREPENGSASMYPGFTGFSYCYGGINENGICIAHATSYSYDETYEGTHLRFRMKEVLDHASSIQDAVQIMNTNKTCGYNILISDGKINKTVVLEQNKNLSYIGSWNQKDEANNPCWPIKDVIRRTNFYINKTMAATQRPFYDPRNPVNYLKILEPIRSKEYRRIQPQFWYHYKSLSRAIEKDWGSIDLLNAMVILRMVYNGKNNIMFKFNDVQWMIFHIGYYAIHQWVACPRTGDMLISFASSDSSAYKQTPHLYNLYHLMTIEP